MIEYTIFERSTGKIVVVIGANKNRINKKLEKYPEADFGYIEGRPPEPDGWKVENGAFVRIPGF